MWLPVVSWLTHTHTRTHAGQEISHRAPMFSSFLWMTSWIRRRFLVCRRDDVVIGLSLIFAALPRFVLVRATLMLGHAAISPSCRQQRDGRKRSATQETTPSLSRKYTFAYSNQIQNSRKSRTRYLDIYCGV